MERFLLRVWDPRHVHGNDRYIDNRMGKFFHFKMQEKVKKNTFKDTSFKKFLHPDPTRNLQPRVRGSFIRLHSMNADNINLLTISRC